jgi:hypothetical protein
VANLVRFMAILDVFVFMSNFANKIFFFLSDTRKKKAVSSRAPFFLATQKELYSKSFGVHTFLYFIQSRCKDIDKVNTHRVLILDRHIHKFSIFPVGQEEECQEAARPCNTCTCPKETLRVNTSP